MTKIATGGHPDLKMVNPAAAALSILPVKKSSIPLQCGTMHRWKPVPMTAETLLSPVALLRQSGGGYVPRPGFETALCAGHAASLNLVAALVSRAFCSARI